MMKLYLPESYIPSVCQSALLWDLKEKEHMIGDETIDTDVNSIMNVAFHL